MLEALRQLFETKVAEPVREPGAERERALKLAAAALLFEIARADAAVRDEELTVMRASLQSAFGLSREETEELVRLAEQQSRSATSLYEFTALVDAGLDAAQKKRVIELLWLVAFADGAKGAHEEHLVRRIAGLLHVPTPTSSTPSSGRGTGAERSGPRPIRCRKSRSISCDGRPACPPCRARMAEKP
jgi:uncharacterized tellurite resistance protein B-like protein